MITHDTSPSSLSQRLRLLHNCLWSAAAAATLSQPCKAHLASLPAAPRLPPGCCQQGQSC